MKTILIVLLSVGLMPWAFGQGNLPITPGGSASGQQLRPAAPNKDNAPVGEWLWMDKTILKIDGDGSASRKELDGNRLEGKWLWDDKAKLTFHIDWNHKVSVWFTMTKDLSQISGKNSLGGKVAATRVGAVIAKTTPEPKATPGPKATPESKATPGEKSTPAPGNIGNPFGNSDNPSD